MIGRGKCWADFHRTKSIETKNRRNNKKLKFAEKVFNASGFILKASWTRIFTNTGTESTQAYLRPNWLRPPQIVITAALSRATHQSLVTFPNSTRAAWIFHLAQAIHRKLQLSSPGQLGILAIKDFHDDFPARARFAAPILFFYVFLYSFVFFIFRHFDERKTSWFWFLKVLKILLSLGYLQTAIELWQICIFGTEK